MSKPQDQGTKVAFLSPLDQLNSSFYLRWALVFHVNDLDKAIDRLKKGLIAVTTVLPYLKGQVVYRADNCNNRTPSFTRAVISWSSDNENVLLREHRPANGLPSLASIKEQVAPAHLFSNDLFPSPTFIDTASSQSHPVFETTYTLIEGGLILSMCVHHGVMDGRGLATVTELWASFTCQQDRVQNEDKVQLIDLPDPEEPLTRTARLSTSANGTTEPETTNLETSFQRYKNDRILEQDPADIPSLSGVSRQKSSRIFAFSGDKLKYTKEFLADNDNCHVTINSILSAVIWCNVTRIRLSRRLQQPHISFSRFFQLVDGRQRLGPTINKPGPYLGNVVLTSSADVSLDVLATRGTFDQQSISLMAPTIRAIGDAAAQVTTNYISGFLSVLQQVQDLGSLGVGRMSQHEVDFCASSWANLPLYECDFGPVFSQDCAERKEGTPLFVRYPYIEFADGNMIVLPRRRTPNGKDETIEACVMMVEDDLTALAEDSGFCSWLKI